MAIRGPYATTPEPREPRSLQERLRWLRKRRGLTQMELSTALGCDQAVVSNWEVGRTKPSPSALSALATHYGVDVETLVSGDQFMEQASTALMQALAPEAESLEPREAQLKPSGPGRLRFCDLKAQRQDLVDPADAIAQLLRALKQGRQAWVVVD